MRTYFYDVGHASGYYQTVLQNTALPFGWTRSGSWFCSLLNCFWPMMKARYGYRVRSYVDGFSIAPFLSRPATSPDFFRAQANDDHLLVRYGLIRHQTKGIWNEGAQVLEHFSFVINTMAGTFGVPAVNLEKLEKATRALSGISRGNTRRVPSKACRVLLGMGQRRL